MIANHTIAGNPLDLAISSDETIAVVRTNTAEYFLDLQSAGAPIVLITPHVSDPLNAGSEARISKLVGVIENRAVVGGYVNQALAVTTPGVKTFEWPPAQELVQPPTIFMPGTVDVEVGYMPVTGDAIGVLRHDIGHGGQVSLRDMKTGASIPGGFSGANSSQLCVGAPGSLDGLIHALRLTSNRVIAITNQDEPHSPNGPGLVERGVVTIGHVGVQPAGWPKRHVFTPCGQPLSNGYELVHDVATSPNGLIGVVSGTQVIGVYNLRTGAEIQVLQGASLPTPNFLAPHRVTTGASVAVTNQRAVVIGNNHTHNGLAGPILPGDPFEFRIAVLDTTQPAPLPSVVINASTLGIPTPARVHQVAVTPNGSKAIVTTRAGTLVFDLTQPVTVSPLSPVPALVGATDPLGFTDTSFVADSVACTDAHAVVVGRGPGAQAQIEIIQLLSPTLASTVIAVGLPSQLVPTDVAISPDGSKALVRSRRHASASGGLSRLTVISLATATVLLDIDAALGNDLGTTGGLDHVVAGNGRAVSVGSGKVQVLQL